MSSNIPSSSSSDKTSFIRYRSYCFNEQIYLASFTSLVQRMTFLFFNGIKMLPKFACKIFYINYELPPCRSFRIQLPFRSEIMVPLNKQTPSTITLPFYQTIPGGILPLSRTYKPEIRSCYPKDITAYIPKSAPPSISPTPPLKVSIKTSDDLSILVLNPGELDTLFSYSAPTLNKKEAQQIVEVLPISGPATFISESYIELLNAQQKLESTYQEETDHFCFRVDKIPSEQLLLSVFEDLRAHPLERTETGSLFYENEQCPLRLLEKEGRCYFVFPHQITNGERKSIYLGMDASNGQLRIISELKNYTETSSGEIEINSNYETVCLYPAEINILKDCQNEENSRVLPIYDVIDIQDGLLKSQFTVQEFCYNGDLASWLMTLCVTENISLQQFKEKFGWKFKKIGGDLFEGLISLHNKDVLHRDVKLQNFFLNKEGIAFLGDFDYCTSTRIISNDKKSNLLGDPNYAAPEFFSGGLCPESEIWSLGLTLFSLFGLQTPEVATEMGKACNEGNLEDFLKKLSDFLPWKTPPSDVKSGELVMAARNERKRKNITLPMLLYYMLQPNPEERFTMEVAYEIYKQIPVENLIFASSEEEKEEEEEI
jgi:hypothetical protein